MDRPELHEGRQQLTADWAMTLPFPMARRIEDGSLVFWHSPRKLTFWLSVFGGDAPQDPAERLGWLQSDRSPDAFDQMEETGDGLIREAYRLREGGGDDRLPAFYGHAVAPTGDYLLLAAYFDFPELHDDVLAAWRSFEWSPDGGR